MVQCKICGKELRLIHYRHLNKHNITLKEYKKMYPGSPTHNEGIYKGPRMYGDDNPMRRPEVKEKAKKWLKELPKKDPKAYRNYIKKLSSSLKGRKMPLGFGKRISKHWQEHREELLLKTRKSIDKHKEEIIKQMKGFEKKGYKCIPTHYDVAKVIPDFIAVKNSKV
ncbi:unnamed protein product, partial [marine sediment metagenome]